MPYALIAVLAQGPSVEWRSDLEAAMAEGRRDGRPLAVVFR